MNKRAWYFFMVLGFILGFIEPAMAVVDPGTAIIFSSIIAGGINGILGFFGGLGEAEMAEMSMESKEQMAADLLGFKYSELTTQKNQYNRSLRQRMSEWADQMGLDRATLKLKATELRQKYGLEKAKLGLSKERLGLEKKKVGADIGFRAADVMKEHRQEQRGLKRGKVVSAQLAGPGPKPPAAPTPAPTQPPGGAPAGVISGPMKLGGEV